MKKGLLTKSSPALFFHADELAMSDFNSRKVAKLLFKRCLHQVLVMFIYFLILMRKSLIFNESK